MKRAEPVIRASEPQTHRAWTWWVRLMAALFLSAIQGFALNPQENPSDYGVDHWDNENGLPHNAIKQLIQTRDGYLWVGTQAGLARFDGQNFTVFTRNNTPAMASNLITSFAETADGSLWIGTSDGLVRYFEGNFTGYSRADGLKDKVINTLGVAADGSLWIGGREGIVRWSNGKFLRDIDTTGHSTLSMHSLTAAGPRVWVAMSTEVLRLENGAIIAYGREQGLVSSQIQTVSESADGTVLAVTQNGLFRLEHDHFVPFEKNASLSNPRISRVLWDHDKNLWIGNINGLDRFQNGRIDPYLDRYGKKLGVVDALLEDREGCVWVGTSEGLYRFTDRRVSSMTEQDGASSSLVLAVNETHDQSLWVSMWGAGVSRIKDGVVKRYTVGAPLSHETVTAIYESPDGVMWLGNRGCSIDRLEDGKVTTYVYKSGVATSRPITALISDDDGTLLIGIANRGLFNLREENIVTVPEARQLTTETVWKLGRNPAGKLQMATSAGLYERTAEKDWRQVDLGLGRESLQVRDFIYSGDDLWLATDGRGLGRWRGGKLRTYGSRQGLVDDTLFTVLDDGAGYLWMSSARGLFRVAKADFDAIDGRTAVAVNPMAFGRLDGLASGSSSGYGNPTAIQVHDGRILTATDKGVAVAHPRHIPINQQPPTVIVENLIGDGQLLPGNKHANFSSGTRRLEIRYTALSLIAPQRIRFRYKLEGSDPQWIEAGHERRAYYTNLPPGNYTFHVTACNNDGVWNESGTAVRVTMLPHFYETSWFRTGVMIFLIAAVCLSIWLRNRQLSRRQAALKRRNAELDQRVRERTAELSQSHQELQHREQLFRLIFEHAPVGISWKRADLGSDYHLNATFRQILQLPDPTLPDLSTLTSLLHPEDLFRQIGLNQQIESGKRDDYTVEQRYQRKDGATVWAMLSVAVVRDQQGQVAQHIGILEDITTRKKAERELAETYKSLVDVSRTAGMAEVATGVLHNVGNVLNSLNISASIISEGLRQSRAESFAKLAALIQEHSADLGAYLTSDPKGKRVPEYIDTLARHFLNERTRLQSEVTSLQHSVDHIREIISMQQAYATKVTVAEPLDPVLLMEDALHMNSSGLARHDIHIVREFETCPPVLAEKGKAIQILINLISNAKQACTEAESPDKSVTLGIKLNAAGCVCLSVRDTGVGIPAENLTRIFAHGFTTKANGHGFGLHSSANAAREMKGSLTVHSEGRGHGATFVLELPAAESKKTA